MLETCFPFLNLQPSDESVKLARLGEFQYFKSFIKAAGISSSFQNKCFQQARS